MSRDGTFTGTPSTVSGLPADSDQALRFPGDVYGEVADDAGLHLASFSVSGWLKVEGTPTAKIAVWSKDLGGLNDGDFAVTIDEELELSAQFQDTSTQHITPAADINLNTTYNWAVVAGSFGFDFFLDGKHVGRNTGYTDGWTNNDKAIQFAKAPWTSEEFVGVLDEVALFDFQLTDANVITLSQVTSAPVAAEPTLVVTENGTVTFDPFAPAQCVGRKSNLVVELWDGANWVTSITTTHGSANVLGNGDIEYTAGEVTQNETDSFDYRITDANGASASTTITVDVNDSADEGGGTLAWEWQISETQAQSWIDGVALSDRDYDDVLGADVFYPDTGGQPLPNRWIDATTVLNTTEGASGPTIWKRSNNAAGNYRQMCFNRAPDGSPALELYTPSGEHGVADFWLELFNPDDGNGPKHLRVVMEVKTCKASDPTTHKGEGVGTTGGTYPDFQDSHSSDADDVAMKYVCQMTHGPIPRGAALTSYWNGNNNREINGIGHMMQTGSGSKDLKIYSPAWDRPNAGGVLSDQLVTASGFDLNEPGMQGEWHKLEIEVKVTDPTLVPTDDSGTRNTVFERPAGGDGETWVYATPDIDGALGSPGQRTLVQYADGQIMNPSADEISDDDNMHTLLNLTGPWVNFYYGGTGVSQNEAWLWIRKIQVYKHD